MDWCDDAPLPAQAKKFAWRQSATSRQARNSHPAMVPSLGPTMAHESNHGITVSLLRPLNASPRSPFKMMMASDLSSDQPRNMLSRIDFQISHTLYQTVGKSAPHWLLLSCEHSGNGFIWIPGAMLAVMWPGLGWKVKVFAINLEIGFLLDVAIVGLIKMLVKRSRPDFAEKQYSATFSADKYSFPSGHASRCILIACMVLLFRHMCHVLVLIMVAAWAVITALSRVFLGRHFFFDVVVGSMIGVVLAGVLSKV